MGTTAARQGGTAHPRVSFRTVPQGVVGGLAGGVVFGIPMQASGMIPMVAMLVGSSSTAVGWVVHLAVSAAIGAGFGLLLAPPGGRPEQRGAARPALRRRLVGARTADPHAGGPGDAALHGELDGVDQPDRPPALRAQPRRRRGHDAPAGPGLPDLGAGRRGRPTSARCCSGTPRVAAGVTEGLGRRLAELEERLADALLKTAPQRVASTVATLALSAPAPARFPGPRGREVRLTHAQLADLVGTTRETTTKVLGDLRDLGVVALRRGRVVVLDVTRLHELADAGW